MRLQVGSFLLTVFFILPLASQSLERQVVSSAGTTLAQGGYSIDFTLGETITATQVAAVELTQGFHQVWVVITASEEVIPGLDVNVYPNPVQDWIHMMTGEPVRARLINDQGQVLLQQAVETGEVTMEVGQFDAGFYLLYITSQDGTRTRVFKMIKIE